MQANEFLEAGLGHMQDRASTYDKPAGERSMLATVKAFEEITGVVLTEEQGWLFMVVLKLVRSQQGNFRADNYEDAAAYCGLQGEAAYVERYLEKDPIVQGMRESQGEVGGVSREDEKGEGARGICSTGGPTPTNGKSTYTEKAIAEAERKSRLVEYDTPNFDKYRGATKLGTGMQIDPKTGGW